MGLGLHLFVAKPPLPSGKVDRERDEADESEVDAVARARKAPSTKHPFENLYCKAKGLNN